MLKRQENNFKSTTKTLFLKYALIPNLIAFILFSIGTILLLNIKVVYDAKKSAKNIEKKAEQIYESYVDEMDRMIQLPQVFHTIETKTKNHFIYEEFYNFNNQMEVKSGFHLIDKRDVFLVSTTPSNGENNEKIIDEIIPFINKNPDEIYMNVDRSEFENGQTAVLNMGTAVRKNDKTIGYIIYQLYDEGFQDLIFGQNTDIVVLTDDFDYIVASTNRVTSGLMNKFTPEIISKSKVKIKKDHYYLSKIKTKNNMFMIYTMNNTKKNIVIYILYFTFILLIGSILYFLFINMAEKMSSKNVQSIEKLMVAVSQLKKGDMTAYVEISTGDEFEIFADQYNDMLDSLNNLLKKNEELSTVRNSIEMKLLESKFNPHFVFNVLETLRYTMFIDTYKAQEIIYSLSRILRYSVDYHPHEVLFEKDLNYMFDYLKLHKFRFGDRLTYDIDIEEAVIAACIPKLLLQPIIENSIKYGYKNKSTLSITIEGKIIDETIIFKIKDNGSGMDSKKLRKINENLYSSQVETNEMGTGLLNTQRRIVLQYGNDYGLTINSQLNLGTEVMIKLPYNKETDESCLKY